MKSLLMIALLGVAALTHAADFYEWTDEKGVKQFTQQPPPGNARNVQQRRLGGNTAVESTTVPYGTQQAVKTFPVTLYATDCGEPCNNARAHLNKRGVPFTEKSPLKPEETEAFKKVSGGALEVPLLVVGALRTLKGYLASDWDLALDQAGYPSTALPGSKPAAAPPPK